MTSTGMTTEAMAIPSQIDKLNDFVGKLRARLHQQPGPLKFINFTAYLATSVIRPSIAGV